MTQCVAQVRGDSVIEAARFAHAIFPRVVRPIMAPNLRVSWNTLSTHAYNATSAPGELCGALGRLGYLCARGAKAMFVAAADHSMLPGPR